MASDNNGLNKIDRVSRLVQDKQDFEKRLVYQMIQIYCRNKHGFKKSLCEKCDELNTYTAKRISLCPFMAKKTFCSRCTVHCFDPDKRAHIKTVMRFSGPRVVFYHPIASIKHLLETKKGKG